MDNMFLPIGSVVLLKGGSKKIMITGYLQEVQNQDKQTFDYRGCPFPEGVMESKGVALFNKNDIEKVCYKGYEDEEVVNFLDKIEILSKED